MIRFVIIIIALLLVSNSALLLLRSNLHFGTFFVYALTIIATIYALFFDTVNAICSDGLGLVLAIIFIVGLSAYIIMMFVVARLDYPLMTKKEKAVIVLGAGLNGTEVSKTLKSRLDSAIRFYNKHKGVTICVTGSKGYYEIIPEAQAMRQYLLDNGIPSVDILYDPDSHDTYTNIKNALILFDKHHTNLSGGVLIATNHFHCYRSAAYAKMQGITAPTFAPSKLSIPQLLPSYSRELAAIIRLWVLKK